MRFLLCTIADAIVYYAAQRVARQGDALMAVYSLAEMNQDALDFSLHHHPRPI